MKISEKYNRYYKHIYGFIKTVNRNRIGLYAAQAAFFTILSAVPFLILLAAAVKRFANTDIDEIITPMLKLFPETAAEYAYGFITREVISRESAAVVSVTVISAMWSASRGTMAVYGGLNNIFGTTRPENWFFTRLVSFIYTIIIIAAIVVSVIILIIGNILFKFIFRLRFLCFFLILTASFSAIYSFLPQRKNKYISQLPGAAMTASGWIVFSYLFSLYIRYFSKFPILYGSLTALALLMLWVYFSQYMFLIGAQINETVYKECRQAKKL